MRSSILSAVLLDVLIGDPRELPHPVNAIGAAARAGEPIARVWIADEFLAGAALTSAIGAGAAAIGALFGRFEPLRSIAAASTLAYRSLLDHLEPIASALESGDVSAARVLLARCVGRDTGALDEAEIARAAVETAAESLCDGIIAPLVFLRVFGTAGAFLYKAVNTLDSLIGHPEEPYRRFGTFAARLDDVMNWIPARIAAAAICVVAPLEGGSARQALEVWRRDGDGHRSPNAGQSEAAMAGTLGIRLGGSNSYEGVVHDGAVFGSHLREPGASDIRRAMGVVTAAFALVVLCSIW